MRFLCAGRRLRQASYRYRRKDRREQLADVAVGFDGVTHGLIQEQAITIAPSLPDPLYDASLLEV